MAKAPTPNGGNGRDGKGRFTKGNHGGPGNPHAQHVARLREALLKAVKPDDIKAVIEAMLRNAKDGNVACARELLNRLLGPPIEMDILERLEALEERFAKDRG